MERRGWVHPRRDRFGQLATGGTDSIDRKGGTSRIRREAYVRFCEGLGVKIPGPTRRVETERRLSPPPHSITRSLTENEWPLQRLPDAYVQKAPIQPKLTFLVRVGCSPRSIGI